MAIHEIERRLLRNEGSATAVHWATFLEDHLELDEILKNGLVSADDQRIFDFAGAAGGVLGYEVIRPDGVTALSSWAGDFGKTADDSILRRVLSGHEPYVALSEGVGFGGNPVIQTRAYVPVIADGRVKGVIKVLVDMTDDAVAFRRAANLGLMGLYLLLVIIAVVCGVFVRQNIRGRDRELKEVIESRERLVRAEEKVQALHRQLRMILDAAGEGIYGLDLEGRTTFINPAGARMLGWAPEELIGRDHHEVLHPERPDGRSNPREESRVFAAIAMGEVQHVADETFRRRDGTSFPVEYTCAPIAGDHGDLSGAVVVFSDITERKRAERMQAGRNRVLERLTAGDSLSDVLTVLVHNVEEVSPETICSVLLLDESGKRLCHAAAPSLPAFYNEAVDGLEIGPGVGSCGTAAYTGERVVVSDVMIHPFWTDARNLAGQAGLRACWSEPIGSAKKGILGTFAIYYRQPREPEAHDLDLIQNAARLAEIAIIRKRTEELNTRLGRIIEDSMNEIYVFNSETFRFIQVNRGACENLGYSIEELSELTPLNLNPLYTWAEFEDLIEPLRSGAREQITFETVHRRKNDSYYNVEVRLQLARTESPPVFLAVIEDITQRKLDEAALLAAKKQAEHANQAKSVFLANMSHELRTPLNAVIGFSEVIEQEVFGPAGNPKYREYARDVRKSGQHLLELINDILDLSKIESGSGELSEEVVSVPEMVRDVITLVKQRARTAAIKVELDIRPAMPGLIGDRRKLKQILANLLSNAIKFTESGDRVVVKAWCNRRSGHVFQVIDTGIGMAAEDIPKALAPFQQVDCDLNRKFEGTGLGLPLTKALVELHGGSLDLQSEVGVGTTVTVRFPRARIRAETPERSPSATRTRSDLPRKQPEPPRLVTG
jgi:PAS domain S-box-containing protein